MVTLLGGLVYTGEGTSLSEIVGSADAFRVLMWASFAGAAAAGLLTLAQGILRLEETVQAWYSGVQTMLYPMIILLLAWSLSTITQDYATGWLWFYNHERPNKANGGLPPKHMLSAA